MRGCRGLCPLSRCDRAGWIIRIDAARRGADREAICKSGVGAACGGWQRGQVDHVLVTAIHERRTGIKRRGLRSPHTEGVTGWAWQTLYAYRGRQHIWERFAKGAGTDHFGLRRVHFVRTGGVEERTVGEPGNTRHDQFEWLEKDLADRPSSLPIIVFGRHCAPPCSAPTRNKSTESRCQSIAMPPQSRTTMNRIASIPGSDAPASRATGCLPSARNHGPAVMLF